MKPFSYSAEVRLIRWGESSSAGRTITLELPPDAGEGHPFKGFPTGHSHGQRFTMRFSAIGDDEEPAPAPQPRPSASESGRARYLESTPSQQALIRAARLPKDERFRAWVACKYGTSLVSEETAAGYIRESCCGGESRKMIAEDRDCHERFLTLETAFKIDVGEMAEPR